MIKISGKVEISKNRPLNASLLRGSSLKKYKETTITTTLLLGILIPTTGNLRQREETHIVEPYLLTTRCQNSIKQVVIELATIEVIKEDIKRMEEYDGRNFIDKKDHIELQVAYENLRFQNEVGLKQMYYNERLACGISTEISAEQEKQH